MRNLKHTFVNKRMFNRLLQYSDGFIYNNIINIKQYCNEYTYPIIADIVGYCIKNGHLNLLVYYYDNKYNTDHYIRKRHDTMLIAIIFKQYHILHWIYFHPQTNNNRINSIHIKKAIKIDDIKIIDFLYHNSEHDIWNSSIVNYSVSCNNLNILKWLYKTIENEKFTIDIMVIVASHGNIKIAKWVYENIPHCCGIHAINLAAENGNINIVKFIYEKYGFKYTIKTKPFADNRPNRSESIYGVSRRLLIYPFNLPLSNHVKQYFIAHPEMVENIDEI